MSNVSTALAKALELVTGSLYELRAKRGELPAPVHFPAQCGYWATWPPKNYKEKHWARGWEKLTQSAWSPSRLALRAHSEAWKLRASLTLMFRTLAPLLPPPVREHGPFGGPDERKGRVGNP